MILGVPGIDLALRQRLVSLSGPRKESTQMLVTLLGLKSPHKGLYPQTFDCVCHCIMSMFRVLDIYIYLWFLLELFIYNLF